MTHIVAMKEYDPKKPLISIHVPKCAGGSIRRLLKEWFGDRLCRHYFQQLDGPPPRHALGPGTCVHGHFNRAKGFGVMDYYPEADQIITILRGPLEIVTNLSARDEDVPEAVRAEFVERNALAYAIYHYALKHYGTKDLAPPARENGRVRPC